MATDYTYTASSQAPNTCRGDDCADDNMFLELNPLAPLMKSNLGIDEDQVRAKLIHAR